MGEFKIHFKKKPVDEDHRLEPTTCTEAETFALQVRDSSMEPEFRKRCIIVIDPTGHATHGSYVLAKRKDDSAGGAGSDDDPDGVFKPYLFRQLRCTENGTWQLCPLNDSYPSADTPSDFSEVVGVIVQRAGTRRSYHKRYD